MMNTKKLMQKYNHHTFTSLSRIVWTVYIEYKLEVALVVNHWLVKKYTG